MVIIRHMACSRKLAILCISMLDPIDFIARKMIDDTIHKVKTGARFQQSLATPKKRLSAHLADTPYLVLHTISLRFQARIFLDSQVYLALLANPR